MNDQLRNEFAEYKYIVVHAGNFHADDVFTVAYANRLRKFMGLPAMKVVRTFNVRTLDPRKYMICDIGKGRFDHHFPDEEKACRDNGIAYASFGLVAKNYHFWFSEEEYNLFDKKFVEPIDLHDNTGCGNQLSFVISTFNKKWDSDDPNDDVTQFYKALELATSIIDEQVMYIRSLAHAEYLSRDESLIKGDVLYLDQFAPVSEFLVSGNINFVGSESKRGGYQITAVRSEEGGNKKLFPYKFRGLNTPGEYNEYGMSFCHSSGFLANFCDKNAAQWFMEHMMDKE